jgi:hypothetical protein
MNVNAREYNYFHILVADSFGNGARMSKPGHYEFNDLLREFCLMRRGRTPASFLLISHSRNTYTGASFSPYKSTNDANPIGCIHVPRLSKKFTSYLTVKYGIRLHYSSLWMMGKRNLLADQYGQVITRPVMRRAFFIHQDFSLINIGGRKLLLDNQPCSMSCGNSF